VGDRRQVEAVGHVGSGIGSGIGGGSIVGEWGQAEVGEVV